MLWDLDEHNAAADGPQHGSQFREQGNDITVATDDGMLNALQNLEQVMRGDVAILRQEMHKRFDEGAALSGKNFMRASSSRWVEASTSGSAHLGTKPSGTASPSRVVEDGAQRQASERPSSAPLGVISSWNLEEMRSRSVPLSHREDSDLPRRASARWEDWPGSIQLRLEIDHIQADQTLKMANYASHPGETKSEMLQAVMKAGVGVKEVVNHHMGTDETWRNRHVLHPDQKTRWVFDLTSVVILIIDAVHTPYSLSFGLESELLNLVMLFLLGSFWSVDLVLGFFTGFQTGNGEVERRFLHVVRHYVRTTLVFDLTCVAVDVSSLVQALGKTDRRPGGFAKLLRVAKMQRILRIFRVVRILRTLKRVNQFMEAKVSESWRMIVLIWQLSMLLLWLCHVCACIWYSIGKYSPHGIARRSWLSHEIDPDTGVAVEDTKGLFLYLVAFQWALGQISLGGSDMVASSSWERIFTICVNLFGLIFGGALVSILSTSLIDLRALHKERNAKLTVMRDYLVEHSVPLAVRLRVLDQVKERLQVRGHTLVESDVSALQVLSVALRKELRYAVYSAVLPLHPLFRAWQSMHHGEILRALCSQGFSTARYLHDDELFSCGEEAEHAYFVVSGTLTYTQEPHDGLVYSTYRKTVVQDMWLSEATWWCHWIHVGNAIGDSVCNILCLPPQVLESVMSRYPVVKAVTTEYAHCFHKQLRRCPKEMLPNDVRVPGTDFRVLLSAMSQEAKMVVSFAALEHSLAKQRHWKLEAKSSMTHLVEEIQDGKSVVVLDSDGNVWRSVAVDCIQFVNGAGLMLVQLGELIPTEGSWRATCRLPGSKRVFGETLEDTIQRVVTTSVAVLKNAVEIHTVYTTKERHPSPHFGIGTDYRRTIGVVKHSDLLEDLLSTAAVDIGRSQMTPSSPVPEMAVSHSRKVTFAGMTPMVSIGTTAKSSSLFFGEGHAAELREITRVYALEGTSHKGLYAWLSEAAFEQLSQHHQPVQGWLASIAPDLPPEVAEAHEQVAFSFNV